MTTKEFVKKLKELNFIVDVEANKEIVVRLASTSRILAYVSIGETCSIDTQYDTVDSLFDDQKRLLFKLCYEYAITPLEERVEKDEPKKYKLRFKVSDKYGVHSLYLNYYKKLDEYRIDSEGSASDIQTEFTQAEIDEFKEYHGDILGSFDQVEVIE